jgi:hypothetical protein
MTVGQRVKGGGKIGPRLEIVELVEIANARLLYIFVPFFMREFAQICRVIHLPEVTFLPTFFFRPVTLYELEKSLR